MKNEPDSGSPAPCRSCGAPLVAPAAACAACGALSRSRRALSPPAGFFGGVLGVFAGPVVSFAAGFIGYVSVGWTANRISSTPQWLAIAAYIGIQLVPVVLAIVLGTLLLRARRPAVGWFLVVTGIMAFVPAAACDTATIAVQNR